MSRREAKGILNALLAISLCFLGCGSKTKNVNTVDQAPVPVNDAQSPPPVDVDAGILAVLTMPTRTMSLRGRDPQPVPFTDLSVHISGSFHKSRAPLVGVSVLVSQGAAQAEVSWRIESGHIDDSWHEIAGQRWDDASSEYVEEKIPEWLIRLDSVEEHSAGGDPTAITISFKQVP